MTPLIYLVQGLISNSNCCSLTAKWNRLEPIEPFENVNKYDSVVQGTCWILNAVSL
ncbi:hypothetical protein UPYG_G00076230 [Umbra pygmaea]|uniref:Uncharacterized protein n=1 Tax=Umbra pygmaea TaxID=75934 RepID=A0ABD0Y086_UMBPY